MASINNVKDIEASALLYVNGQNGFAVLAQHGFTGWEGASSCPLTYDADGARVDVVCATGEVLFNKDPGRIDWSRGLSAPRKLRKNDVVAWRLHITPEIEQPETPRTIDYVEAFDRTFSVPGYERLALVLSKAYEQSAMGKGKERHGDGLPFHEQRMQQISELLKSPKGMAYQVCKKVAEGLDLQTHEAQVKELLGAIVYTAGIIIFLEDRQVESEG